MNISRRRFLEYCGACAASLGLGPLDLGQVRRAVANPAGPVVIWLHGSSCTGCSVSLLNRISDSAPYTITEVLTEAVNLVFHATIMASAGDQAVATLRRVYEKGNYVLCVEGAIPTAFHGYPCISYSYRGVETPFQQVVQEYAERALVTLAIGSCASYGGIPASGSNPTGSVSVADLTGRPVIRLPGCPCHPDWVVWTVVQLILGNPIPLDAKGRPDALYNSHGGIHTQCPRFPLFGTPEGEATAFGQDGKCLVKLGCRGPNSKARCLNCWNGKAGQGRWCVGVNAPCHGCVEPSYPGPESFYTEYGA